MISQRKAFSLSPLLHLKQANHKVLLKPRVSKMLAQYHQRHHYLLLQEEGHILFRLDTQEMLVEGVLVEDRESGMLQPMGLQE